MKRSSGGLLPCDPIPARGIRSNANTSRKSTMPDHTPENESESRRKPSRMKKKSIGRVDRGSALPRDSRLHTGNDGSHSDSLARQHSSSTSEHCWRVPVLGNMLARAYRRGRKDSCRSLLCPEAIETRHQANRPQSGGYTAPRTCCEDDRPWLSTLDFGAFANAYPLEKGTRAFVGSTPLCNHQNGPAYATLSR